MSEAERLFAIGLLNTGRVANFIPQSQEQRRHQAKFVQFINNRRVLLQAQVITYNCPCHGAEQRHDVTGVGPQHHGYHRQIQRLLSVDWLDESFQAGQAILVAEEALTGSKVLAQTLLLQAQVVEDQRDLVRIKTARVQFDIQQPIIIGIRLGTGEVQ
ncbi:hypothetical protein D9M68_611870 [compost metagenome]